jgi:hypothetical protein
MEVMRSSETSTHIRASRRCIPEHGNIITAVRTSDPACLISIFQSVTQCSAQTESKPSVRGHEWNLAPCHETRFTGRSWQREWNTHAALEFILHSSYVGLVIILGLFNHIFLSYTDWKVKYSKSLSGEVLQDAKIILRRRKILMYAVRSPDMILNCSYP